MGGVGMGGVWCVRCEGVWVGDGRCGNGRCVVCEDVRM